MPCRRLPKCKKGTKCGRSCIKAKYICRIKPAVRKPKTQRQRTNSDDDSLRSWAKKYAKKKYGWGIYEERPEPYKEGPVPGYPGMQSYYDPDGTGVIIYSKFKNCSWGEMIVYGLSPKGPWYDKDNINIAIDVKNGWNDFKAQLRTARC